jgi:predicted metal-dependent phosphoesterase TrpH
MGELVDLHIHSDRSSDGDLPPAEIVRMAAEAGFAALSIATTTPRPPTLSYRRSADRGRGRPEMEVTTS